MEKVMREMNMYSERIAGLKSSAIREILKVTSKPGIISFAGGLPAPELFPMAEFTEASGRVLAKYKSAVLQYSITEGLLTLREKIAAGVNAGGGQIRPQNIIITQGSQQGLDLISKLYIDKGTEVLTETPSYLGALQAFRLFQARVTAIPSDKDGIRTDQLSKALDQRSPALIYLMPNFQNPTGTSLSLERRREMVDLVKQRDDLLVIEDDPYGDLRFSGERLPSLFNLGYMSGKSKNFIYLSSFSKTIAPGLRVAYAVADEEIAGKLTMVKQGTDLQTNTFGQYVVNEYLENGGFREHVHILRSTYASRRDCMLSAMKKYFPGSLKWNRPEGGMFLWVELPEEEDAGEILVRCLEQGVAFVPGREFFPDGSGGNTIRLNFSNASPDNIEEGIRRIGQVLRGMGM